MQDLSLHILDLMENGVNARAKTIRLEITENPEEDSMKIVLVDDGRGMEEEKLKEVLNPFYTTRTTRKVGLGLPLFAQVARETNGQVEVQSRPGQGTRIEGIFTWHHWDRPPMGNMVVSLITFMQGHPEIDVIYRHEVQGRAMEFDTRQYRKELEDIPLNHPLVLEHMEKVLEEDFTSVRPESMH